MLIKEIIEIKIIKRQRSITNPKNWINTFVDLAVIVVHAFFLGGGGGGGVWHHHKAFILFYF